MPFEWVKKQMVGHFMSRYLECLSCCNLHRHLVHSSIPSPLKCFNLTTAVLRMLKNRILSNGAAVLSMAVVRTPYVSKHCLHSIAMLTSPSVKTRLSPRWRLSLRSWHYIPKFKLVRERRLTLSSAATAFRPSRTSRICVTSMRW